LYTSKYIAFLVFISVERCSWESL